MLLGALAVFKLKLAFDRNERLMELREEMARLAVSEERSRFARDLHDILGHSLTVITVKAELAGRLVRADPDRAAVEIADLERLSREALTDVRRAVAGYRQVTLVGELATARESLAAAGIEADLATAVDEVPGPLRELFGWAVREGVTNVIRHSGASRCTVRVTPVSVEVVDDGIGPPPDQRVAAGEAGHGLLGLRERAAAAGASLSVDRSGPGDGSVLRLALVEPVPEQSSARHRRPGSWSRPAGRSVSVPLRLLLADDQALVRGALAALLDLRAGHHRGGRGRPR